MAIINSITYGVGGGGGLAPTIRTYAPSGSTVTCDGKSSTEKRIPNPIWRELPSSFTQLEYIESSYCSEISGGVGINMGFKAYDYNGLFADVSFLVTQKKSGWNIPFGAAGINGTTGSYDSNFSSGRSGDYFTLGYGSTSGITTIASSTAFGVNTRYEVSVDLSTTNQKLVLDGATLINANNTAVFSDQVYAHLFSTYYTSWGNISAWTTAMKLYSAKFYSDTTRATLIRDFVPCQCTDSVTAYKGVTAVTVPSGTLGVYDLIGNRFYVNSYGGTFTAGSVVPQYLDISTWDFEVAVSATPYTVTASLNGKTQSKSVTVDAVALFPVEIDYKLWLYKDGDECEDITGGWIYTYNSGNASNMCKSTGTQIYVTGTGTTYIAGGGTAKIRNTVPLAGYTNIGIEIATCTGSTWDDTHSFVGYGDLSDVSYPLKPYYGKVQRNVSAATTFLYAISNFNTNTAIGVFGNGSNYASISVYINKVWLE